MSRSFIQRQADSIVAACIGSGMRVGRQKLQSVVEHALQTEHRAFAPHCDPTILHAPGKCEFCDDYPDWQAYRQTAGIAFTGEADELGVKHGIAPCPSTWFREPETRDRWSGNRPSDPDGRELDAPVVDDVAQPRVAVQVARPRRGLLGRLVRRGR